MKFNKILSAVTAGIVAVSALACAAFAADDIVLTPDEDTGLTKVTDSETAVTFSGKAYNGVVGGEDNGQWILGGDNGDIGISIDTLKEYSYVELDYTCDNPIEGVKLGFAFKVHVDLESRTCEDGGYIFADYLPQTWVPYGSGADGKQPIAAINSLEEIYQTGLKAEGTLSVSVEELLKFFPEDMDYMMGIGIGANNNHEDIAEEDIDNGDSYTVSVVAVRFTNTQTVVEEEEPEDTSADDADAADDADNADEAEDSADASADAAEDASDAAADSTEDAGESSQFPIVPVIIIAVIVVVVIIIVIVVVVSKKKKK